MRYMTIAFLCLLAGNDAIAGAPWTKEEIIQQGIVLLSLEKDRLDTLEIKDHPNMYETNIVLGKHPPDSRINEYFALVEITHTLLVHMANTEWREWLQSQILTIQMQTLASDPDEIVPIITLGTTFY